MQRRSMQAAEEIGSYWVWARRPCRPCAGRNLRKIQIGNCMEIRSRHRLFTHNRGNGGARPDDHGCGGGPHLRARRTLPRPPHPPRAP